ncbi:MAG: transposase [Thermomicrobiales bacterium]
MRASCDAVLAVLDAQVTTITAQLAAHIAAHVDGAHQRQLLCSAPGIGLITAHLLVADLPELEHLDRKAIAALVGVAPVVRESGARRHDAHIAGGRARVRTG